MRLCVRLVVLAALLATLAVGLISLRTDTNQAGNRLHALFRQKRDLEKACCRLELAIARLKNQERLRERADDLRIQEVDGPDDGSGALPRGNGAAWRPPLVNRNRPAPPKSLSP